MNTRRTITPEMARIRLENLCGRAERCSYELRQKLYVWGIPSDVAENMLADMHGQRWFDDGRFARAFVSDKVRFERRGRLYLRNALRAKRIADDIITAALDRIDPEIYAANLQAAMMTKLRSNPTLIADFDGRTRLFRHLMARGYEPDQIKMAIRRAMSDI